jgi:hypothetical protein
MRCPGLFSLIPYSPKCLEYEFWEVCIAPVQDPWA